MKKVALLYAVVCTGQLCGMNELPKDIRGVIIAKALDTSNTLTEAIKTIEQMSAFHGITYDNLKDATALVTALANKFPNASRDNIILALERQDILKKFKSIPEDLHKEIIKAMITSSKDIFDAIKTIKIASALYGIEYDNLKNFTALVHILADKFDVASHDVAIELETPIGKKYMELGRELIAAIRYDEFDKVVQLINDGADIDFHGYRSSPLEVAIQVSNSKAVKYLLKLGLKPDDADVDNAKWIAKQNPNNQAAVIISQMLEDAAKTIYSN